MMRPAFEMQIARRPEQCSKYVCRCMVGDCIASAFVGLNKPRVQDAQHTC
jgi:hypothetical protein